MICFSCCKTYSIVIDLLQAACLQIDSVCKLYEDTICVS